MDGLIILDGMLFVFVSWAVGYLTGRVSKRKWLGWLVGLAILFWLTCMVPYEFG